MLQDVDHLLAALHASGEETMPRPSWPFREVNAGNGGNADVENSNAGGTLTLRAALTSCYDIRCRQYCCTAAASSCAAPPLPARNPVTPRTRSEIDAGLQSEPFGHRAPKPDLLQALLKALPAPQQNGKVAVGGKAAQKQSEARNGLTNGHSLQNGTAHSLQNGGSGPKHNGSAGSRQQPGEADGSQLRQNGQRKSLTVAEQVTALH